MFIINTIKQIDEMAVLRYLILPLSHIAVATVTDEEDLLIQVIYFALFRRRNFVISKWIMHDFHTMVTLTRLGATGHGLQSLALP